MGTTLELDTLPEKARIELLDFYEFLLHKYSQQHVQKTKKSANKFEAFLSKALIVDNFVMPDRETRNAR